MASQHTDTEHLNIFKRKQPNLAKAHKNYLTKIHSKHAKPQMSLKVPKNCYHVDHVFYLNSL